MIKHTKKVRYTRMRSVRSSASRLATDGSMGTLNWLNKNCSPAKFFDTGSSTFGSNITLYSVGIFSRLSVMILYSKLKKLTVTI